MKNRESLHPGRIKLVPVDAANGIYDMIRADEPTDPGTALNKTLLDYAVAACGVTTGTSTAYKLDDDFGGFVLLDGVRVNFRLHTAMGANATLNVNSTGAKGIVNSHGEAVKAGMSAGSWVSAVYSATLGKYVLDGAMAYHYSGTLTLSASGWSSKKQTVSASYVTASNDVFVSPTPESNKDYAKFGIVCTGQAAGKLTFECDAVPTAGIGVNYKVFHE